MKTRSRNAAWARWPCLVLLAALAALFPVRGLQAQATPAPATPAGNTDTTEPASEQAGSAVPLARGKKLVLTDGSFQIVREYQRQGDRVRYFSTERAEWEEIPDSLVDW